MPDSYIWTIAAMRRLSRMIDNGVIAPSLLEADGLLHVLKSESIYATVREKLPQHLFNETLDLIKQYGQPLDKRDSSAISVFARHLSDVDMKKLYGQLEQLAELFDTSLLESLEQSCLLVDQQLLTVVWKAAQCPAYETYHGKIIDTSHLGAR